MPKDNCAICHVPFKDEGASRERRYAVVGNICTNCNHRVALVNSRVITRDEADKWAELERQNHDDDIKDKEFVKAIRRVWKPGHTGSLRAAMELGLSEERFMRIVRTFKIRSTDYYFSQKA